MTRIAVAGNPNSGKTTLFNQLTGSRARVGNYPGVTVERKEATARLPSGKAVRIIDLPGTYSLTARSPEEEIAHHVLMGLLGDDKPELIVCVIDASNMPRGLYLTLQLLELELPVVVALNMIDVASDHGLTIDLDALRARLGRPVVATAARFGRGLPELLTEVERALAEQTNSSTIPLRIDPVAYGLSPADRASITAVEAALLARGERHSLGAALWLLSSELDEVDAAIDDELDRVIRAERVRLDEGRPGAFVRRLIQARFDYIDRLLVGVLDRSRERDDTRTRRIDDVLMHPIWGFLVFAAAMFVLFQAVFAWAHPLIDGIETLMGVLSTRVEALVPLGLTRSLLVNGVIAGVGSVLVFLPQIALLFLGITLLEETGYMARAAFLLDRLMRRVGLHGKAFIPLMSGFGCAVPAIMASRTIESSRDRLVTILVTPFMSCSARLPVYVLVVAAVFSGSAPVLGILSLGGIVIAAMYLLGFLAAVGTAFVLKRSVLKAPPPIFLMELPAYQVPQLREVIRRVLERCAVFIRTTGGIILALSLVLWALMTFPRSELPAAERQALRAHAAAEAPDAAAVDATLARHERAWALEHSIAGRFGHAIEPVISPLGFDWRIGIGLIASFAAREVLVSTLGQVYALDSDPGSPSLSAVLATDKDPLTGRPRFTPLVGLSLMVFFVLALQCMSTVATIRRETNSWKWPLLLLAYMNGLAYLGSLLVYQVGSAMGWGT